jgi:hypothetical protein
MGHRLAVHVLRELHHDGQQRHLSDTDHVTKLAGGAPTHTANHKTIDSGQPHPEMDSVIRAATGRCED